jgi:glyoxylase-like metal-dependent hydrolase (beta-lactamase superfamily II)
VPKLVAFGVLLATALSCKSRDEAKGGDQAPARPQAGCEIEVERIEVKVAPGFRTNCYVLWDPGSKKALVIDPGAEPDRIEKLLSKKGLELSGILLTHGHPDHVGGAEALQKATGAPVHLHPDQVSNARNFQMSLHRLQTEPVTDGARVQVGCNILECFHTPGHSPGSLTVYSENGQIAFTGDLLFAGGVGRTDLPGGDRRELLVQIQRLITTLPPDTRVLPGHGNETTLATEKAENPFIRGR